MNKNIKECIKQIGNAHHELDWIVCQNPQRLYTSMLKLSIARAERYLKAAKAAIDTKPLKANPGGLINGTEYGEMAHTNNI